MLILAGHVLQRLAEMEPESVNCVVTSPPYWNLRQYHISGVEGPDGWNGEFGFEDTPERYVEHTVDVLRGVRRVLRPDGVVWWNIQGKYISKQMDLIPFKVALAAQTDGWWMRSVIIWDKTNANPESAKDRPTTTHEYILLLTKNRQYWYDADALREPHTESSLRRLEYEERRQKDQSAKAEQHGGMPANRVQLNPRGRNARSVWRFAKAQSREAHFTVFPEELPRRCIKASCPPDGVVLDPFVGVGTVLKVAEELGRESIGIELSKEYVAMMEKKFPSAVVVWGSMP